MTQKHYLLVLCNFLISCSLKALRACQYQFRGLYKWAPYLYSLEHLALRWCVLLCGVVLCCVVLCHLWRVRYHFSQPQTALLLSDQVLLCSSHSHPYGTWLNPSHQIGPKLVASALLGLPANWFGQDQTLPGVCASSWVGFTYPRPPPWKLFYFII